MNKAKQALPNHSPLPWRIHNEDGTLFIAPSDKDAVIAEIYGLADNPVPAANAEFIKTACNNHYQLLEALKAIKKELMDPANNLAMSKRRGDYSLSSTLIFCIEQAGKAIAEASGE